MPFYQGQQLCKGMAFLRKAMSAHQSVPAPCACQLLEQSSPALICKELAGNTGCSSHFNFAKSQQVAPISHPASLTASLLSEGHSLLWVHRLDFSSSLAISSKSRMEQVLSMKILSVLCSGVTGACRMTSPALN